MRILLTATLSLALVCAPAARARDKESKQQQKLDAAHAADIGAAQKAAESWLKIEDAAHYDEAWQAASRLFQSNVAEPAWDKRMQQIRRPLDPVLTRTLDACEYKTRIGSLPPGQYVAFVWETVFASGKPSLESLIMTQQDGQWKMAGYAIQ
jgi:hypothetical protein